MSWTVELTQIDETLWSVSGRDDAGDHMGSNVVGDEQAARAFAEEAFGADATVTVNPLLS